MGGGNLHWRPLGLNWLRLGPSFQRPNKEVRVLLDSLDCPSGHKLTLLFTLLPASFSSKYFHFLPWLLSGGAIIQKKYSGELFPLTCHLLYRLIVSIEKKIINIEKKTPELLQGLLYWLFACMGVFSLQKRE